MKINTVTKTVEVTISNAQLLNLFVSAVYGDAKIAIGKNLTFYQAFGNLVGISDVDAVKIANGYTMKKESRITTDEFRRWLPTVFSEFARAMLEPEPEENGMTIETYPAMNAKIVELLRIGSDNPSLLYAAQRIEELERELHDEQIRRSEWEKMYQRAILSCGGQRQAELEPTPTARIREALEPNDAEDRKGP